MQKVLLFFLSFILISSIQTTRKDTFMSEVKNGYAQYEVLMDSDNDDYSICIIRGINKNRSSFGVYFKSACKDEYYVTVQDGSSGTRFKTDKNDEVYYPAISYSVNLLISIYDCDNKLIEEVTVKTISQATFTGEVGANQGISFNSPKGVGGVSQPFIIVYMVGAGIIALCAIIIILLKVNHKGMFNEDSRKEGIADFKELEETYVNSELHEEEDLFRVEEEPAEEASQVYERTRDYEDEIDETRPSVKSVLEARGFRTDYANMSVEEKNKVMVELMMAREQKVINNDEYQHEIIELWKK